jgi:glucosamine-6-phosphate deaminase
MEIEVLADAGAVATRAADIVCESASNPGARLGLPTGATPLALYEELNRRVGEGACDFSGVIGYAIDEFCDVSRSAPGTNMQYYRQHLRLNLAALHCPDPESSKPDAHIRAFARAIRASGGLGLCVLGIGETGHIAFNEPGAGMDSRARVVDLTPTSRGAHEPAFGALDRVPPKGMTLGIADLLAAKSILVLATGRHKAAIVARALTEAPSERVPASWLQHHPDTRWLLDAEAASLLDKLAAHNA